jgi:hypothetical protein
MFNNNIFELKLNCKKSTLNMMKHNMLMSHLYIDSYLGKFNNIEIQFL